VETTNLVALAGATLLLATTPGPGVLACVSRAITSGFRQAAMLALGIVVGDLVFLILAVYGLAALAKMFEPLFLIARYGGGIYLIWQGLRMWRQATPARMAKPDCTAHISCLISGLLVTLSNPKAIVFYLSFIPAFFQFEALETVDMLAIVATVTSIVMTVLLSYSMVACQARRLFQGETGFSRLRKGSGTVMISAGVALMLRK